MCSFAGCFAVNRAPLSSSAMWIYVVYTNTGALQLCVVLWRLNSPVGKEVPIALQSFKGARSLFSQWIKDTATSQNVLPRSFGVSDPYWVGKSTSENSQSHEVVSLWIPASVLECFSRTPTQSLKTQSFLL